MRSWNGQMRCLGIGALLLLVLSPVGCVSSPGAIRPTTSTVTNRLVAATDPGGRRGVVRIRSRTCDEVAVGSGFLVGPTTVVTNRHVVEAASQMDIETWDGRRYRVADAEQAIDVDLAIVHLAEPSTDEQVELGTDPVGGDDVRVVGYPKAAAIAERPGRVVGLGGEGTSAAEVQINVQIDPGNSGGPVIDGESRVVAVAFAVHLDSGMALAIPVSTVRSLLDGTLSTEPIQPC